MRTQQEILERIEDRKGGDFFGWETTEYIKALDFENAKQYLVDSATAEEWKPEYSTIDEVVVTMRDYMAFAWDKANDRRGISASRSISHFVGWLWLAQQDALSAELDGGHQYYGKPMLVKVAEHYGWDWREWDDGQWTNSEYGEPIYTADQALGRSSEKGGK